MQCSAGGAVPPAAAPGWRSALMRSSGRPAVQTHSKHPALVSHASPLDLRNRNRAPAPTVTSACRPVFPRPLNPELAGEMERPQAPKQGAARCRDAPPPPPPPAAAAPPAHAHAIAPQISRLPQFGVAPHNVGVPGSSQPGRHSPAPAKTNSAKHRTATAGGFCRPQQQLLRLLGLPPCHSDPTNHLHSSSTPSQDLAILLVMLAGAVSVFRSFIFRQASGTCCCCAGGCRRSVLQAAPLGLLAWPCSSNLISREGWQLKRSCTAACTP